jgi:hypothetical protein
MSADESSLIVPFNPLRGLLTEAGEKKFDSVGHVSALAYPMLDPGHIQAQFDFRATRHRIEQAYAFKAGAALAFAAVGHDNVIKRRLFAAASSQTDRHHRKFTLGDAKPLIVMTIRV